MSDEINIPIENDNEDNKKKELEVAEIMCGITKQNNTPKTVIAVTNSNGQIIVKHDIQQKATDQHHQRQAEQITGATPFHLQKMPDGQTVQIAGPGQILTRFPQNIIQVSSGQNHSSSQQYVQYAQPSNSNTIYTDQNNQEIELVECIQTKSERSDNDGFQQVFMTNNSNNSNSMDYQQSYQTSGNEPQYVFEDTEIIQTDSYDNSNQQVVQIGSSQSFSDNHQQYTIVNEEISTESNNQSGLTEITYFDETGAEIGTSQKNFLKQNQHSKVPIQSLFIKSEQPSFVRKRQIAPANRTQQIQVLNSDGQVIQLQPTQTVLPAQTQSTSKSNQVMFAYQTILLPQQNGNQTFQVQNSNLRRVHVQSKDRRGNQILVLTPNSSSGNTLKIANAETMQNVKLVKVDSQKAPSLLDIAASSAGIDLKSEAGQGQTVQNGTFQQRVDKNTVQSHHAYPSPFSQIPINDRVHQCKYCYKRFARADECKRHERIHTDTRPFCCTYCPRRFTRKDHLRTHTRCHTKEKPYTCPLCQRGFARSDERIRHIKTHVKKGECTMEEARAKLGNNQVGRRPTKQTGSASKIPIVSTISSRHEQQATVPISTAINVPLSIGGKQINTFYNSSKGNIILQSSPIQETISSVATIVQVDSDSK